MAHLEDVVPKVPTDVQRTLKTISERLGHLQSIADLHEAMDGDSLDSSTTLMEKQLSFVQKWGWMLGVVAVVFSAGVGYMMFLGVNATDDEVATAVEGSIIEHNGRVDPTETDPATGYPRGHHPDMREAIKSNAEANIKLTATQATQGKIMEKLDKRGRYQFEYTKWEIKKAECKRERNCTRQDLRKPSALDTLETALIND